MAAKMGFSPVERKGDVLVAGWAVCWVVSLAGVLADD
jgi:hypothetical protein